MMKTRELRCDCGRVWVPKEGKTVIMKSTAYGPVAPPAVPFPAQQRSGGTAIELDVSVPLRVSIISGVFVGLIALVFGKEFRLALGAGLCVAFLVWTLAVILFIVYRYEKMRELTYKFEEATGLDIDGDNQVGEPKPPGRTVIKSAGSKRPRFWRNLSAVKQQDDKIAFAVRVYRRQEDGEGIGQKAMKAFVLPSGFKCGPLVHTAMVLDLIEIGAAHESGRGFKLCEFDGVHDLVDFIRDALTVGE